MSDTTSKTYIEFFSDEALENVMVLLSEKPDKVIYLGHKSTMVTRKIKSLTNFAKRKTPNTKLEFIEVSRDDLQLCIDALTKVADEYPDAYYELSGGGELLYIAFGYISANRKLKTIRIDPYTGHKVTMLPGEAPAQSRSGAKMSVQDNIILHGGLLTKQTGNFSAWKFTDDFKADIRAAWDIAKTIGHKWNSGCAILEDQIKNHPADINGYHTIPLAVLKDAEEILKRMKDKKLITEYIKNEKSLTFKFKNDSIRNIVTKTGNLLELHVYEVASRAPEVFNDEIIGAMIDWNGEKSDDEKAKYASDYERYMRGTYSTLNEIDDILMRGCTPIFISCKSGKASSNSLHELQTVTSRFGGKYACKALAMAMPCDASSSGSSFFKQRAKEMHIWVIDDIYHMTDEELLERLKKIRNT